MNKSNAVNNNSDINRTGTSISTIRSASASSTLRTRSQVSIRIWLDHVQSRADQSAERAVFHLTQATRATAVSSAAVEDAVTNHSTGNLRSPLPSSSITTAATTTTITLSSKSRHQLQKLITRRNIRTETLVFQQWKSQTIQNRTRRRREAQVSKLFRMLHVFRLWIRNSKLSMQERELDKQRKLRLDGVKYNAQAEEYSARRYLRVAWISWRQSYRCKVATRDIRSHQQKRHELLSKVISTKTQPKVKDTSSTSTSHTPARTSRTEASRSSIRSGKPTSSSRTSRSKVAEIADIATSNIRESNLEARAKRLKVEEEKQQELDRLEAERRQQRLVEQVRIEEEKKQRARLEAERQWQQQEQKRMEQRKLNLAILHAQYSSIVYRGWRPWRRFIEMFHLKYSQMERFASHKTQRRVFLQWKREVNNRREAREHLAEVHSNATLARTSLKKWLSLYKNAEKSSTEAHALYITRLCRISFRNWLQLTSDRLKMRDQFLRQLEAVAIPKGDRCILRYYFSSWKLNSVVRKEDKRLLSKKQLTMEKAKSWLRQHRALRQTNFDEDFSV